MSTRARCGRRAWAQPVIPSAVSAGIIGMSCACVAGVDDAHLLHQTLQPPPPPLPPRGAQCLRRAPCAMRLAPQSCRRVTALAPPLEEAMAQGTWPHVLKATIATAGWRRQISRRPPACPAKPAPPTWTPRREGCMACGLSTLTRLPRTTARASVQRSWSRAAPMHAVRLLTQQHTRAPRML